MAAKFVELCEEGDLEGVQAALQSGVDVNSKDKYDRTGLMMSLEQRHTGVSILLLEQKGIDINTSGSFDKTALHFAAGHDQNSEALAMMLLARNTSVNQRDSQGQTPLYMAVSSNAVRCIQLLISYERTNPNISSSYHQTPLGLAVYDNNAACVELLLNDKRTDPNIKDLGGNSPLMWAVKRNRVACAELLLADPRVDLSTRDNCQRSMEEVAR